MALAIFAPEDRQQALALKGQDAFVGGWVFRPCNVCTGGHNIDEVADLMGDLAPVLNHARPVCDERCRDTTFVVPPLEFAKRRIAEIGPGQIYRTVRRHGTGRNIGRAGPVFIAGTVVGQKQHEGIFLYTEFAEFGLKTPDVLVHAVDHGRVNGHLQIPGISILNLLPRQRIRIAR